MILETEQEKRAFELICSYADRFTDRGCNDLSKEEIEFFKGITITRQEMPSKKIIEDKIKMDFDVLFWLKQQVKYGVGLK